MTKQMSEIDKEFLEMHERLKDDPIYQKSDAFLMAQRIMRQNNIK